MGNHRFKLWNIMSGAWFYKLKEYGNGRNNTIKSRRKKQSSSVSTIKRKKQSSSASTTVESSNTKPKQAHQCNNRKSCYFPRELPPSDTKDRKISDSDFIEPPRNSSKRSSRRRGVPRSSNQKTKVVNFSVSDDHEFRADRVLPIEWFDELVIDVDENSLLGKDDNLDGYLPNSVTDIELPPIVTKPSEQRNKYKEETSSVSEQRNSSVRRFALSSPGLRLRVHSPRIGSRKVQAHRKTVSSTTTSSLRPRRSLSESFAIVKSSVNPQRDFKDSMVEMIAANNLRGSNDLEDLLACYLLLNSDEYHDLIIYVFKQIWFDLYGHQVETT